MNHPIRTGALFGLVFTVVFGLVAFAIDYAILSIVEDLYPDTSYGEPTVVRSEPVLRDGELIVLVTVENASDDRILFDAEAAIFDKEDEYLETCYTDRQFEVDPRAQLSFQAACGLAVDGDDFPYEDIGRATIQFY